MPTDHKLTRSDAIIFVLVYLASYCVAGILLIKGLRIVHSLFG